MRHWDLHFSRSIQDRELDSLDRFMDLIYSSSVSGRGDYKMGWKPDKSRGYEEGGYYQLLCPSNLVLFPGKIIWGTKIPPRGATIYILQCWFC